MNNKNDNQGGDPGSMQMSSVHQSSDPNTTQSDDLYQSLNPKMMQQDDIYLSLNPNTTQLRAADQSLNPNTTRPEDIYQNLASQHHSSTENWHFTLSLKLFSLIPNGWWNLIALFCQCVIFNYILDYSAVFLYWIFSDSAQMPYMITVRSVYCADFFPDKDISLVNGGLIILFCNSSVCGSDDL